MPPRVQDRKAWPEILRMNGQGSRRELINRVVDDSDGGAGTRERVFHSINNTDGEKEKKKHHVALKPWRFMDILTCWLDVHSELQARLSSKVWMRGRCGETERQIQITSENDFINKRLHGVKNPLRSAERILKRRAINT